MKILIFEADEVVQEIKVKDQFVFLMADDGRVYHIDSTDGNMWRAEPTLINLGKSHAKEIAKRLEDK